MTWLNIGLFCVFACCVCLWALGKWAFRKAVVIEDVQWPKMPQKNVVDKAYAKGVELGQNPPIPQPDRLDDGSPCVGDFCQIPEVDGTWIPYASVGGRSDGDVTRYDRWLFVRHPKLRKVRIFRLDRVSAIGPHEQSRAFWPNVVEWIKAGAHEQSYVEVRMGYWTGEENVGS